MSMNYFADYEELDITDATEDSTHAPSVQSPGMLIKEVKVVP